MMAEINTMSLSTNYPPATRGKLILWGMLAAFPFGGMTWQALQYIAGLRRLGYDVWYVEDADGDLLDPLTLWPTIDYTANVHYLSRYMNSLDLGDRWVFRPPGNREICLGATDLAGLEQLYREADAVINLCGYHSILPGHDGIKNLVYLQTDPVVDQVNVAKNDVQTIHRLDRYQQFFTYGENLGAPDCPVPIERYRWQPTRPPVCLDWWPAAGQPPGGAALTTISNWKHWENEIEWKGEKYHWRKDKEFRRFIDLPTQSKLPLELALEQIDNQEKDEMRAHGWQIVPAHALSDPVSYRSYICSSLGEFTIAKDQYVRLRTGWFSDRSVCYLAAGRPVVTQETGFSKFFPVGKGLFAFLTMDDILNAIEMVLTDYEGNSRAAREIAAEYFAAEKVLGSLMERMGL